MSKSETRNGWPSNVGILAMEIYFPSLYVDQTELESYFGVSPGKYTIGLGQSKMGFCTDLEDVQSFCLTAVENLMEKNHIDYESIGRIEVGTETIIDKSKSIKTVLMQLFESSQNSDIEGIDTTNACYGGTAAIFNSVAWIESSAWDGRLALVVACDIAIYASGAARPTGGAGAVAMILGPNAPLVFERGLRASDSAHVYDFYKPDLNSEYPRVDGALSLDCYMKSLDKCYRRYAKKAKDRNAERITQDSFDAFIFHAPFCKLVQKCFGRLLLGDVLQLSEEEISKKYPSLVSLRNTKLEDSYSDRNLEKLLLEASKEIYLKKTKASLALANQVGNMYTASTYASLLAYLTSKPLNELYGNRLCLFSYGSGYIASMFSIKIPAESESTNKLSKLVAAASDFRKRLECRRKVDPEDFAKVLEQREAVHDIAPHTPVGNVEDLFPGTYYMVKKDEMHRREYARTANGSK